MNVYRNINWTRRDFECTNVVFQITPDHVAPHRFNGQIAPEGEWVKAESVPSNMEKLGTVGGIDFYGFL